MTVKTPKLYWVDLGIVLRGAPMADAFSGAAFETLVVTEAHKWTGTSGREVDLSFYRTRSGFEVDLIVATGEAFFAIEAKAREVVTGTDFRGLRALAQSAPPGIWRGGLCVHKGSHLSCFDEQMDLWAVPVHRLFA